MERSFSIRLRQTELKDIERVINMERDPENTPFIRQWTREQHIKSIAPGHYGHYTIRDEENGVIGYIILSGLDNPDKSIELKRIVIRKKEKGLGRQAVERIKEMVFDELGAHRLWLEVMQTNARARHVYKSCGFVMEGIHRESMKTNDQFVSLDVMSILRHEYEKLYLPI